MFPTLLCHVNAYRSSHELRLLLPSGDSARFPLCMLPFCNDGVRTGSGSQSQSSGSHMAASSRQHVHISCCAALRSHRSTHRCCGRWQGIVPARGQLSVAHAFVIYQPEVVCEQQGCVGQVDHGLCENTCACGTVVWGVGTLWLLVVQQLGQGVTDLALSTKGSQATAKFRTVCWLGFPWGAQC